MAIKCQQCGAEVAANDWFCSFCGQERPMCPDCGAEMDDEKCKNCGTPRQAPCTHCGLMIEATLSECPNCEHNEKERVKEKNASSKRKAATVAGFGGLLFIGIAAVTPGPSIIGVILGGIVSVPIIGYAGLTALVYANRESNADDHTVVDLSKGREQNKTKQWREMKREERMRLLESGAQAVAGVGETYASYAENKQYKQERDEAVDVANQAIEAANDESQKRQAIEQENQELKSEPTLPDHCPRCGTDWSGGVFGSKNVERFSNGRKASCTECTKEVLLFRR